MYHWERIAQETYRLKVYGGWLVKVINQLAFVGQAAPYSIHTSIFVPPIAMSFVPDMNHEWKIENDGMDE